MTVLHRPPELTRAPATGLALHLSAALALAAGAASVLTFAVDGLLLGPPVMNGSARGTALLMFLAGVPVLVVTARMASAGSVRAQFGWAGAAMFLTYNSFMLLTATPINRLFLLYVAAFGLSIATLVALAVSLDVDALAQHVDPALPARPIAGYLLAVVALNALAWLGRVVPATVGDTMPTLVDGMGIATVPTYVQDLAFWLPLVALGAWWLWHRRPWGYLVAGASLVFWTLEAATVAVDQWFGHQAAPASDIASDAMVIPFAALAVIGAVVTWSFLRRVRPHSAH
jgi:hypothetical protein